MGTNVHLMVRANPTNVGLVLDEAEAQIHAAEARWSRFKPSSELSQINRAVGQLTLVSPQTFELLALSCRASLATGGAFDPTVGGALVALGYDDDFESVKVSGRGLHRADGSVNQRSVNQWSVDQWSVNQGSVQRGSVDLFPETGSVLLTGDAQLDFGGIAKGFVADKVAAQLIASGADGCCVNIGGDARMLGVGPDDESWLVLLTCDGARETRTIRLAEGAVCTSSATKRRWQSAGGPAHHLIDPTTGQSRSTGPTTVTAIAATATSAEVITKWMMAGGSPADFEATGLTVDLDGAITHHRGLELFLT
ncbi:MAG: thiamine biosynthesis lipoprotein [Acidimicrobiales bacterium]|jgi:FAD:protein FMN transferase